MKTLINILLVLFIVYLAGILILGVTMGLMGPH